jgi:3-phosphoshikimate 1-carboxyvinyltransferase
MTESIEIVPVGHPVDFTIRPPGSKSLTNRALICAALADGTSILSGALFSDDTHVMLESLTRLGFSVDANENECVIEVAGLGGAIPNETAELFIKNSGTTVRFLTAMLAMAGGDYRLDGVTRMHERPIGPLVDALSDWGADVTAVSPGGCPPVVIGKTGSLKDLIKVRGDLSSQYLSGILMAAPLVKSGLKIKLDGHLVSKPYVAMTTQVMKDFGAKVLTVGTNDGEGFFVPANQTYQATNYSIEPDASAASYFFAAAAILGGSATVTGLHKNSLQGDVGFVHCLEKMGCEVVWNEDSITVKGSAKNGIDVDMSDVSDTVQTLASVALFVDGPTHIRNVAHNRVKETDRIGNLVIELRKLGVKVEEHEDGLTIHPGPMNGTTFATYDDHRMAMSFALIGLKQPGVFVEDPDCVAKTYPRYFDDLTKFVR